MARCVTPLRRRKLTAALAKSLLKERKVPGAYSPGTFYHITDVLSLLFKPLPALWACNLDLSFALRHTEGAFAAGAFEKFIVLSAFKPYEEILRLIFDWAPVTEKLIVFRSPLHNIS